jgi:hypothetical protein
MNMYLLMVQVVLVELLPMELAAPVEPRRTELVVHDSFFQERSMTMLTLDVYSASSRGFQKAPVTRSAIHRLFAAAVVSDQFRKTLLRAPEEALANGYLGQTFALTDQEKKIIKTIRAETLTDFAQKVNQALKTI